VLRREGPARAGAVSFEPTPGQIDMLNGFNRACRLVHSA